MAQAIVLSVLLGPLQGCAPPRLRGDAPRFDPAQVMREAERDSPWSAQRAREVLASVSQARRERGEDLLLERIDCHAGVLISGCLARVDQRERQLKDRLDGLEVAAQQRLRDLAAMARTEREADALRARLREAAARQAEESRQRERFDQRQQEAERAQAEREAQRPELLRREQEQTERRRERERAYEQRQTPPATGSR